MTSPMNQPVMSKIDHPPQTLRDIVQERMREAIISGQFSGLYPAISSRFANWSPGRRPGSSHTWMNCARSDASFMNRQA